MRDVLLVRIEDHVPGHAVVFRNIGERIVNACAIQSGLAYGIQQCVHRVICERSKLLWLFMKPRIKPRIEFPPLRSLRVGS